MTILFLAIRAFNVGEWGGWVGIEGSGSRHGWRKVDGDISGLDLEHKNGKFN